MLSLKLSLCGKCGFWRSGAAQGAESYMKKMIFKTAVITFSLLFFCGCKAGDSAKTPEAFSAKVSANFFEAEYTFDLVKEQTGGYMITVDSPESLKGMTVKYSRDKTVLSLNGVENTLDFKEQNSVFSLVTAVLDDSSLPDRLVFEEKDGRDRIFSGSVDGRTYRITYSFGEVKKISVAGTLEAEFEK